ncbi:MAG: CueP family metal-binding protein [Paenibacillus sp.]|nr:CueP family metal-binding protein [Paenibacillus sp.]
MRKKVMAATGLIAVAIAGYMFVGGSEKNTASTNNTSTNNTNVTQDVKKLVSDYSLRNIKAESASITSQQLIVTDEESKSLTYELPENEFFVSTAPYVEETHPCAIHSLTGCQGEMVNEEFNVQIVDMEGNSILDKTLKSQANGFIDLWLPRDKKYCVTIEHNGKTVESEISTFKDDDTCISTMQLI